MTSQPKVSVLVPVYNGEKYLAECLDSVLAQDFASMEILIADDGSTDGSRELIRHYAEKDPRIRWWRNPANLGLAGNFNACLRAARNDYIKYVLQDDVLLSPSAIRQMAQALDADPAVSLVASASYVIDGASNRLEFRNSFRRAGVMDGKAAIRHCMAHNGNCIGEPSVVMFRREPAARGFDERCWQIIDLEFWFHLLERGRFAYIAEPLCAFRQHAGQQTAVNRRTDVGNHDQALLLESYYARPWFDALLTRQILFNQIYQLRRTQDEPARAMSAVMRARLTQGWYFIYWTKHKLTRPFLKMGAWLQRRLFAPPNKSLAK